jgi:hypothetical protein
MRTGQLNPNLNPIPASNLKQRLNPTFQDSCTRAFFDLKGFNKRENDSTIHHVRIKKSSGDCAPVIIQVPD